MLCCVSHEAKQKKARFSILYFHVIDSGTAMGLTFLPGVIIVSYRNETIIFSFVIYIQGTPAELSPTDKFGRVG